MLRQDAFDRLPVGIGMEVFFLEITELNGFRPNRPAPSAAVCFFILYSGS